CHGGDRRVQLQQHDLARRTLRGAGATYHIESPEAIDPDSGSVHYRLPGVHHKEADDADWLPSRPVRLGITAGASTPNSKIGEAVARILATRGLELPELD